LHGYVNLAYISSLLNGIARYKLQVSDTSYHGIKITSYSHKVTLKILWLYCTYIKPVCSRARSYTYLKSVYAHEHTQSPHIIPKTCMHANYSTLIYIHKTSMLTSTLTYIPKISICSWAHTKPLYNTSNLHVCMPISTLIYIHKTSMLISTLICI
jgi:hypothetical protein